MAMMVFAFLSLTGGYFLHQYFWLFSLQGAQNWNDSVLPMTVVLGWILLLGALILGFAKESEG